MRSIVIDASFVLRAILSEKSQPALEFKKIFKDQKKGKVKIYAPSFILLEVANGFRFSLKEPALAEEAFIGFSLLPIEYFNYKPNQIQEILKFSFEQGTTVYDSAYHLLARLIGGMFYTCDAEYFQKVGKSPDLFFVA